MSPPSQSRRPIRLFFPAVFCLFLTSFVFAQDAPEPKPLRFDLTPFAGYRSSITFPVDPHVSGTRPAVVLDASPSYGISFGFRLLPNREEDLIELRWARQDSYLETQDITPAPPREHVVLHQIHGDFSHEPYIEDWPHWAKPYVLASVGATYISSSSISL